jgi:hypothetical protein
MDPMSKHVNDVTQRGRRAACVRSRNEGHDATDDGDRGGRSVYKSMNIQCRKRNTKLNTYFEHVSGQQTGVCRMKSGIHPLYLIIIVLWFYSKLYFLQLVVSLRTGYFVENWKISGSKNEPA